MNQISSHIAYLLLSCRNVTVPGLGTFSAFYEKASFDSEEEIFYPSRIRIKFTSILTSENFQLSSSLRRKLKIKENEAYELISEYVKNTQNKLKINRFCRLDGIGYLIMNRNGSVCFKDTFWKDKKYLSSSAFQV